MKTLILLFVQTWDGVEGRELFLHVTIGPILNLAYKLFYENVSLVTSKSIFPLKHLVYRSLAIMSEYQLRNQ